jgi:hypothetical protein
LIVLFADAALVAQVVDKFFERLSCVNASRRSSCSGRTSE